MESEENLLLGLKDSDDQEDNLVEDHYKNRGRVLQLSFSFFLLFVSFNTCQNLASTVLEQQGLEQFGFYVLASLYFVFIISSFLSAAIVDKMGVKLSMIMGAISGFTFALANLLAIYPSVSHKITKPILIITAMFDGFGSGI